MPWWREAQREEARQELREATRRSKGSHRLSGAGCSALQGGCSSHHHCCHLPALLSTRTGLTQGLSLGFPMQEQSWEVGGGNGSVPCSRRFLSALCALIFFSCGSRERPVSQITKAVTDTAGAWGELCTRPESSPPSSWESHQNARSWFYPPTNGTFAGCCQRCEGQQQDAQPPLLGKADSEMPTHGQ